MLSRTLLLLSLLLFPPACALAQGSLDSVRNGYASGWALDDRNPSASVVVHFYGDAPAANGGRLLGSVVANRPRPDVNQATGLPGDHGFRYRCPPGYGQGQRRVYAYAIYPGRANPQLTGSPRGGGGAPAQPAPQPQPQPTPPPSSAPLAGSLDSVRGEVVSGWALDPQAPAGSVDVHLYHGGPAGSGRFLGAVRADRPRPDVNQALGVSGRHGFRFSLPAAVRSGGTLYAYAILTGGANPLLENSPLSYGSGGQPVPASNGAVDGVDGNGVLRGWATAPEVRVRIDGQDQGSTPATLPHPGVSGDHGFAFTIPSRFRDGVAHTAEVVARTPQGLEERIGLATFSLSTPGTPSQPDPRPLLIVDSDMGPNSDPDDRQTAIVSGKYLDTRYQVHFVNTYFRPDDSVAFCRQLLNELGLSWPIARGARTSNTVGTLTPGAQMYLDVLDSATPGQKVDVQIWGPISTLAQALAARPAIANRLGNVYWVASTNRIVDQAAYDYVRARFTTRFRLWRDEQAFRGMMRSGDRSKLVTLDRWLKAHPVVGTVWRKHPITEASYRSQNWKNGDYTCVLFPANPSLRDSVFQRDAGLWMVADGVAAERRMASNAVRDWLAGVTRRWVNLY